MKRLDRLSSRQTGLRFRSLVTPRMKAALPELLVVTIGAWLLFVAAATACPPGTVFSAKSDGTNGICAFVGRGATAAVRCSVARGACPAGTSREHSSNDPHRDYCCSSKPLGRVAEVCVQRGNGPFCAGRCKQGERVAFRFPAPNNGCMTGSKVLCCFTPSPR